MESGSTHRIEAQGELHSTRDHYLHDPEPLGWELTLCNALQPEESPCRKALRHPDSYGNLLLSKVRPEAGPRCLRCGRCCVTDLFAFLTDEDTARWEQEGREDILHILKNESAVWAGDRLVSRKNGHPLQGCPFLALDGSLATCTIYSTRPKVCRDYLPGSSELCPHFKGMQP